MPDGSLRTYGGAASAILEGRWLNHEWVSDGLNRREVEAGPVRYAWGVSEVQDATKTAALRVTWQTLEVAQAYGFAHEFYPSTITYTHDLPATEREPLHEIEFEYDGIGLPRTPWPDRFSGYVAGFKLETNRLLRKIIMRSGLTVPTDRCLRPTTSRTPWIPSLVRTHSMRSSCVTDWESARDPRN